MEQVYQTEIKKLEISVIADDEILIDRFKKFGAAVTEKQRIKDDIKQKKEKAKADIEAQDMIIAECANVANKKEVMEEHEVEITYHCPKKNMKQIKRTDGLGDSIVTEMTPEDHQLPMFVQQ